MENSTNSTEQTKQNSAEATPSRGLSPINANNWAQVKGSLKQKWSDLSEDELDQTRGDMTRLESLMQTKYGYQAEEARKHLQSFIRNFQVAPQVGTENQNIQTPDKQY